MLDQIDTASLQQYLADDPPTVAQLAIKPHFEALNSKEKKYAHYISRASFAGTRINFRQVSAESEPIYDFILALHKACNGRVFARSSHTTPANIHLQEIGSILHLNPACPRRTCAIS